MTVEAVLRVNLPLLTPCRAASPSTPTGQGRLWMYESRYTTLLNTSHPHHRQDSELPTGEHISASIESSTVLVPHASSSGWNAGRSRTGRSPAADGSGPTSLGPHVQWARPQPPPRASKDERPTAQRRRGVLGLLGLGVSLESRHALVPTLAPGTAHGSGSKELPRQPLPAAVRSCCHGGK